MILHKKKVLSTAKKKKHQFLYIVGCKLETETDIRQKCISVFQITSAETEFGLAEE